jgi:ribonuclease D
VTTQDLIVDDAGLAQVISELENQSAYALDTEFHRERTYFPRLALVQIAWPGGLALVDATAVDLRPLAEVFDHGGVMVAHAADQDLEVLEYACGTVPTHLFDTQVAAGFVGMANPSLSSLLERELGIKVPKGDRLTDWLARPLSAEQLRYAATDVAHLLEVHDKLVDDLTGRGRLQWALDECEELRQRARGARDPEQAWRRIKEARQLRGGARAVAQSVAAWRERRAAELDQPVRYVLPDLAVVGIAQRPPKTAAELKKLRGLEGRGISDAVAKQVLDAVAEGKRNPPPVDPRTNGRELERELRPAVGLVSAWVSQLARDLEIETSLLATRNDLEALLRAEPGARLSNGWRATLVGEPIRRLVEGEAALAFAGGGRLVLEERSHRSLTDDPGADD